MILGKPQVPEQDRAAAEELFAALAQVVADHKVSVGWLAVQKLFACVIATALDEKADIETTTALLAVDLRKSVEGCWDAIKKMQADGDLARQPPAGSA